MRATELPTITTTTAQEGPVAGTEGSGGGGSTVWAGGRGEEGSDWDLMVEGRRVGAGFKRSMRLPIRLTA